MAKTIMFQEYKLFKSHSSLQTYSQTVLGNLKLILLSNVDLNYKLYTTTIFKIRQLAHTKCHAMQEKLKAIAG